MYRNCKWQQSNCGCNTNNCVKEDVLSDTCDNVVSPIMMNNNCECGFDDENNMFPSNPMFGQSYVPIQTMNETFTPCVGLKMGTIFPELVSPYMPNQSMEENEYIRRTNEIGEGCNKC